MEEEHGNGEHVPATFDQMFMSHLDRQTAGLEALDNAVFEGVLVQVSNAMYPIFWESAELSAVKQSVENIRAKFDRFVEFIQKPGVFFNEATNAVTTNALYMPRAFRRVRIMHIGRNFVSYM